MANPTVFARAYSFRNYQTSNPTDPLPGVQVDIELNNAKTALDSVRSAVMDVRRSDGSLQNGIVTADSLDESALALIGSEGFNVRGVWATSTLYAAGDLVRNTAAAVTTTYVCAVEHVSGTFSTDYTAGKWVDLTSARAAGLIAYDSTISDLVADTVQDALDEIVGTAAVSSLAGEIRPWPGIAAPTGWSFCYGQVVSRATYPDLFTVLTIQQTGTRTNASAVITGLSDTSNMVAGMPVSGTGIPSSTTISSVDAADQITLSQAATSSGASTVVVAPWGVGDGSTTFNLPDLRGRALIGRDDMGASAANRVTSASSGIAATRVGATGGLQTLMAHTHTVATKDSGTAGTTAAVMEANASSDGTITTSSTGTGSSHGNMQPSGVVNWIIKLYGAVGGGTSPLANLGTMSSQNATAVNIDGGSIDGTTIGATSASTGAFTALSVSSGLSVSAGGASITGNSTINGTLTGLTGLTVASGGASITGNSTVTGTLGVTGNTQIGNGSANYWDIRGNVTTGPITARAAGSDTNIGLTFITAGNAQHSFATNGSVSNIQFAVTHTASANRYVTITGSNGGSPAIGTSAGNLSLSAGGILSAQFAAGASVANYWTISSQTTGNTPYIYANGSDTNVNGAIGTQGTGSLGFFTNGITTNSQLQITHTASANRYVTITGSNGGNPTIGTSGGNLALSAAMQWRSATAATAGGALIAGFGSDQLAGLYWGSGAPTVSAGKGSLYIRTDGSTTNDRMYVNTNGSTTWTAVITAA